MITVFTFVVIVLGTKIDQRKAKYFNQSLEDFSFNDGKNKNNLLLRMSSTNILILGCFLLNFWSVFKLIQHKHCFLRNAVKLRFKGHNKYHSDDI